MREEIMQTFEVKVLYVDMILGDSDWQPEFNAKINDAGFTFTGGLYVGLDISGGFEDDFFMGCYVPVARRVEPIKRPPENGGEASMPEFMEYRAFAHQSDWGAAFVNGLIAANRGKLPTEWMKAAMMRLEAVSVVN